MSPTDTLADLPLATLFSAPLIAAIDASAQAQTETIDLLREVGFESDGTPATVSFEYATTDVDDATGEQRRRPKTLEVPLLLFLSVPELVVHEIEQTFSARIVDVEDVEREDDDEDAVTGRTKSPSLRPQRLHVAPAGQSETFARRTKTTFDLDVTMRAEVENRSTGMDLLERSLMTTVVDGDSEAAGATPTEREKAKRAKAERKEARREKTSREEATRERSEDPTIKGDDE
ncbi:DUF2589 domain-containing protein [Halorubrum cibi]|uniref:DUF2589 domain-containing protein n=1 Tax=Halorubrum cibi TaxID=413815 RepID=A0A521B683_9EURY|nr:DUF2589 domain-containing protein [Halorubrum cibi]SMO42608.1 Protein of unknown function [Halorubrum cibi]